MPDPPPTPSTSTGGIAPGTMIGERYLLLSRLAKGGMAEVWEAVDEVLTRPVAVKILLPHLAADEAFVTRFRQEAISAARLSDPHIVSIYDTCSEGDREAIVMELVRGTTLRRLLDDEGHLNPRQAVDIAVQIADALEHAHRNGLVHRDVKPGNILLSDDDRVLVADFGIAKAAEGASDLTEAGQVVGTAKYLSPEQVEGLPLDARSDVYALGVVIYEMLCGRPPFSGDNATTTAVARLTSEPLRPRQIRAGLPRPLEEVVLRAMARRPGDRYSSAAALRSALERVDLSRVEPADATAVSGATTSSATTSSATTSSATTSSATTSSATTRRPQFQSDPQPSPAPAAATPGFARSERSWLIPAALIVVVALTLGTVGLLIGRTELGRDLFGAVGGSDLGTGGSVAIAGTASFDPQGNDGRESDDELGALTDGDPSTAWTTVRYESRELGGLKDGVGVILQLQTSAELRALEVTSPTRDWTASVYVADAPASELSGWGEPVDSQDGIDGGATFDLGGRRGGAVLLWITDLGDGSVGDRFEAAVSSVNLLA